MARKSIEERLIDIFKYTMELADNKRLEELDYDCSFIDETVDIPYLNDEKSEHTFDIYSLPQHDKHTPVIVNIHGGGLIYGKKELNKSFGCELVRRGFKVANLNYELLPNTTLLGQLHDIMAALDFLCQERDILELNVDELFIVGDSAGALLAFMTAAINANPRLQNDFDIVPCGLEIKGLGLFSIMLDTYRRGLLRPVSRYIIGADEEKTQAFIYLNNPQFLRAKFPKTFLVSSEEDVLKEETLRLKKIFDRIGVENKMSFHSKGENYTLGHIFPITHPLYKESVETIDSMCDFLYKK